VISAAGVVLHTFPEGNSVWGVTSLDNLLYVLRSKASQRISVYDTDSYRLQQRINVPQLDSMSDMTACAHYYCLYISDGDRYIHRAALPHTTITKWLMRGKPAYLSVTKAHTLLVTFDKLVMIREFTTHGGLLNEIDLLQDIMSPWHTIQLSSGEFIVCHYDDDDPVDLHRVCLVGSDGQVVKSFGGRQGSGSQQLTFPSHVAVDRDGFVFVADRDNLRVLLLSPLFTYVREIMSREQPNWEPLRLFLDHDKRRLYVAENTTGDDDDDDDDDGGGRTAGRVVVISV